MCWCRCLPFYLRWSGKTFLIRSRSRNRVRVKGSSPAVPSPWNLLLDKRKGSEAGTMARNSKEASVGGE